MHLAAGQLREKLRHDRLPHGRGDGAESAQHAPVRVWRAAQQRCLSLFRQWPRMLLEVGTRVDNSCLFTVTIL